MMKKLLVALALFPMAAFANVSTGTFELSGGTTLGFSSGSQETELAGASDTTDITRFGLGGTGLYYVTNNVAIGGRLGYLDTEFKYAGGDRFETGTLFLGPAIAVEGEVAPQISVFGVGSLGYVSDKTKTTNGGLVTEDNGSGLGFGLEVGAKYFVVKNFSFNAALAYDWAKLSMDSTPAGTPKRTDSNFGLNVGLSVYFGGASH